MDQYSHWRLPKYPNFDTVSFVTGARWHSNRRIYGISSRPPSEYDKSSLHRSNRTVLVSKKSSVRQSPPTKNVSRFRSKFRFSARMKLWKTHHPLIYSMFQARDLPIQNLLFCRSGPLLTLLRYMVIDFHLAELVQKIYSTDVSIRKRNLLRARGHYERFLKLLDSYDILDKANAALFESYIEDKDHFSTASTRDSAARRDAKISRFKEEKELKRKLEVQHIILLLVSNNKLTQLSSIFKIIPSLRSRTSK